LIKYCGPAQLARRPDRAGPDRTCDELPPAALYQERGPTGLTTVHDREIFEGLLLLRVK